MNLYLFLAIVFAVMSAAAIIIAVAKGRNKLLGLVILVGATYFLYKRFPAAFFSIILPYVIAPACIVGMVVYLFKDFSLEKEGIDYKNIDKMLDMLIKTNKGNILIKNIDAGVLIFGASGSGKTNSWVLPIMEFFENQKIKRTGYIYDYKDGELTEFAKAIFGDRLQVVAIHRPEISKRINIIDPRYLGDEKDINSIVQTLLDNLNDIQGGKGTNSFFYDGAAALVSACVLRFKMDFPDKCTLPHLIAFLLAVDFQRQTYLEEFGEEPEVMPVLKRFLTANNRVRIQASPFLLGMNNERQSASVLSTMANALRKVAYPDSFWILSKSEIRLDVNNKEVNSVISFLNEPKNSPATTPLVACMMSAVKRQMMKRDMLPSFAIIDEGATFTDRELAESVATMRTFGMSTVFCTQDISQGINRYTENGFRMIVANLSAQAFGVAKEPKSAGFYEEYMELIKDKATSKTNSGDTFFGFGGKQSTTKSEKEVAKIRKSDFMRFKTGEFAFLSNGVQKRVKIPYKKFPKQSIGNDNNQSLKSAIELNYEKIIEEMIQFAETI